jgi:hypothetical protein
MFKLVDYTDKLEIMGGEPLTHPNLPEIVDIIMRGYSTQIGVLRLLTNGTIIPSQKLFDVFQKNKRSACKMDLLVSHYGDLSNKAEQIVNLCEKNEISCRVDKYYGNNMYYGGWVSFGTDIERPPKTPEETLDLFQKCSCAIQKYTEFIHGKLYPCSGSILRMRSGLDDSSKLSLIDLFENTSMEVKRAKFLKYIYNTEPYYICRYCDGMTKDSIRYSPS